MEEIFEWFSANSDAVQAITAVISAVGVFGGGGIWAYKHFWESSEPSPPPADLKVQFSKKTRSGKLGGGGLFTTTISNDPEARAMARDIELFVDNMPISEHKRFRLVEELPDDLVLRPAGRFTFTVEYWPTEPYEVDSVVAFVRWTDSDGQHDSRPTAFPSDL